METLIHPTVSLFHCSSTPPLLAHLQARLLLERVPQASVLASSSLFLDLLWYASYSLFNIHGDFHPGNCQGRGSRTMWHSGTSYPSTVKAGKKGSSGFSMSFLLMHAFESCTHTFSFHSAASLVLITPCTQASSHILKKWSSPSFISSITTPMFSGFRSPA